MIKYVLDYEGFSCLEAEDAVPAHAMIVDRNSDLMLLDWMLPNMSGIELMRRRSEKGSENAEMRATELRRDAIAHRVFIGDEALVVGLTGYRLTSVL